MKWQQVSTAMHDRVHETLTDPLARNLAALHAPHCPDDTEPPTCLGCDRAFSRQEAPVWPCRTFDALARAALAVQDVEQTLLGWPLSEIGSGPAGRARSGVPSGNDAGPR